MSVSISIDNKYIYKNLSSSINPEGIVHICHGMAEHIGRYNWLIKKLNDDGSVSYTHLTLPTTSSV